MAGGGAPPPPARRAQSLSGVAGEIPRAPCCPPPLRGRGHSRLIAGLVGTLLVAAAVFGGVLGGAREWVTGQADADTVGPSLAGGRAIAQSFRAPSDGLVAVDLLLANVANAARTADGGIEVTLLNPAGKPAAAWRLPAARVVDHAWHRFRLPAPLAGIAGERLTIVLRRPESGGRPVAAWTTAGDAYPDGAMAVDGAPAGGDLAFRARFRPDPLTGARLLLASTGYPPLVGAALLAGLVASALGMMWLTWTTDADGDFAPPGP